MTDYETLYRDLVAGVTALADEWAAEHKFAADNDVMHPAAEALGKASTDLRALLAPSPAEGEGACTCGAWDSSHCDCPSVAPAPVSSGEGGPEGHTATCLVPTTNHAGPCLGGPESRYATDHGWTPHTNNPFSDGSHCRVMLARYACPYSKEGHDPALPPVDVDVFGYRRTDRPAPITEGGDEPTRPQRGEDRRRWGVLFNDITKADTEYIRFTERMALADFLWQQGWRRDVRPEDVTERAKDAP